VAALGTAPHPLHLAGEPVASEQSFSVLNPATAEPAAEVGDARAEEIATAIDRAAQALPEWKRTPAADRARILLDAADRLEARGEELARLITLENGKPLPESRHEVGFATGFLRWFAEEGRRANGAVVPSPDPSRRFMTTLEPVGVVGAITPWNFPATMVTRKIAPALAAGCAVVLKPASETPLTALAFADDLREAGLPPGLLSVVPSTRSSDVGQAFCESAAVRKISFTGSTEVGRELMRGAAEHLKQVGLELGGNAPAIVFDDADLELAVEHVVAVKLLRVGGQSCICANRIFVQDGIYDDFRERLVAAAGGVVVADGLADGAQVGPLINADALDGVRALVAEAEEQGAVVHRGECPDGSGFWHPVTVVEGVSDDMRLAREELFGPVAPLYRFSTEAEAIERANGTPFGLAAYLFTESLSRALRVGEALECGFVGVNDGQGYTQEVPFGGWKQSGLGREGGADGLREYLETKTWAIRVTDADAERSRANA
jgi:succinate-semialdehyde dehydrogenase/glutarate-semialdehyde dehydrogenase